MSRRAAYVEWTVRECQDATQLGLMQIRRRFIDTANTLLDDGSVPAVRAASRIIVENFPPVARVADVSDGERIEDLCDIPDADLERMREIRDAARAKNEQTNLDNRRPDRASPAQHRISTKERKRRTRRLILLGSYLDHRMETDSTAKARAIRGLDEFLERDQDRAVFGLSPRSEVS